jgi:hypothetical protein
MGLHGEHSTQFVQVTYDNLGQKLTWTGMGFSWNYLNFKKYRRYPTAITASYWLMGSYDNRMYIFLRSALFCLDKF